MATYIYAPNENAIEFINGDQTMTVTLSDTRLSNRIKKLAKKYPDRVKIIASGKENGGYMYAHLPLDFLQIRPVAIQPKKTEEQIEEARKNIVKARESRSQSE